MNSREYRELIQACQNVYEQKIGVPLDKPTDDAAARKLQQMIPKGEKVYVPKSGLQKAHYEPEGNLVDEQQDLFDIVKSYLLDEGYVTTEEEALYMMSNMSEETIRNIIEAAVQPSLITSKGKAQNFTKPNRVPFTSSTPVSTRSTTQAKPPNRPSGGFGNKPAGQLKLDLNKPSTKPVAIQQRSQQFRDVQRLNKTTGGGVMGTTKPTNLEPRAPKPAWKPTTKPAATSTKPTTTATKPAAKPTTTSTKPNTYRPGATVRATGPNMDKFPELQRFANQARKVAEPVSKVAGAVAALRNITPAGVAAAVMAPRPTADGTLTAALKRGDYKPKQGPANPDQGLTKSQSFDKAFAAARKSNKTGFTWNNKTYNTKMKESVDDFNMIQDYLISEGYVDNAKAASAIVENMSEDWLDVVLEDLEERRKQLMQRQRQQVTASQERVASYQQAKRRKRQKAQEKEQLKNELRKELRREAVGDPISPSSVYKLSDKDVQKNLQSTMKPAGPAPMKPAAPKPKQQSSSDRFVKRIVGSTMLSPL